MALNVYNGMGNDPFVGAAESASFPLPGTCKREGGEKTQPLHHFPSHLGILILRVPSPLQLHIDVHIDVMHASLLPAKLLIDRRKEGRKEGPSLIKLPLLLLVRRCCSTPTRARGCTTASRRSLTNGCDSGLRISARRQCGRPCRRRR